MNHSQVTKKMRFEKMSELRVQNPHWPVEMLCRVLGVSRSGYWLFCQRQRQPLRESPKHHSDAWLLVQIRVAYRRGRRYSGSGRVHQELRERGIATSRKRVARLMKQDGLVGRSRAHRPPQPTTPRQRDVVAPNVLERRFTPPIVARPNRFWCGDITYLPTQQGWLYLATVKDLFSRRVLGWSMGETLESTLVETAWKRALGTRGFSPEQGPELYHSDRGSQYTSHPFQDLLAASHTQPSMSRTGQCLDNAVSESFFGTLKAELLGDQPHRCFVSKASALDQVGDYIDNFYNLLRRHSTLGYKSPIAFELAHQMK